MTLEALVDKMQNPDRVRIFKDEKEIYTGFLANFIMKKGSSKTGKLFLCYKSERVKSIQVGLEIRHRKWEELNLMKPLEPNETPNLLFGDVELKVYHMIYI